MSVKSCERAWIGSDWGVVGMRKHTCAQLLFANGAALNAIKHAKHGVELGIVEQCC